MSSGTIAARMFIDDEAEVDDAEVEEDDSEEDMEGMY